MKVSRYCDLCGAHVLTYEWKARESTDLALNYRAHLVDCEAFHELLHAADLTRAFASAFNADKREAKP